MLWGSGNDVFVFCRVVLLKHRLMAHILMGSRTSIKISSLKSLMLSMVYMYQEETVGGRGAELA